MGFCLSGVLSGGVLSGGVFSWWGFALDSHLYVKQIGSISVNRLIAEIFWWSDMKRDQMTSSELDFDHCTGPVKAHMA